MWAWQESFYIQGNISVYDSKIASSMLFGLLLSLLVSVSGPITALRLFCRCRFWAAYNLNRIFYKISLRGCTCFYVYTLSLFSFFTRKAHSRTGCPWIVNCFCEVWAFYLLLNTWQSVFKSSNCSGLSYWLRAGLSIIWDKYYWFTAMPMTPSRARNASSMYSICKI